MQSPKGMVSHDPGNVVIPLWSMPLETRARVIGFQEGKLVVSLSLASGYVSFGFLLDAHLEAMLAYPGELLTLSCQVPAYQGNGYRDPES